MVYFLRSKSDAPEALQQFLADCATFGKVKRLRSDDGTGFMPQHFQSILRENYVRHETTAYIRNRCFNARLAKHPMRH